MAPTQNPHRVSAVLRVYTRTDEAIRAIEGLAIQDRPPDAFAVIDSGSADWVVDALRAFAANGVDGSKGEIPFHLIEIPNSEYQSAHSLNQAIAATQGDLVAVLSQDAVPTDAHYLGPLVAAFDREDMAGSYSRQVLGDFYHPLGEKDLEKTYPRVSRIQHAPDCWFVNTCSVVRRDLWERHPFDEHSLISEDHEWGQWAQSQGYVLKYVAEAAVAHYHHFARLSDLWNRHYEEGRGLARIHGGQMGAATAFYRYVREVAGDAVWLCARLKPWYIPSSILRRGVKHAALYRGWRAEPDKA